MAKAWFLIKSEPFVYPFDQLVADGTTVWEGVRNYEARNTLRAMKKGDMCLYYHSSEGKEIVGVARVSKPAYQDPTTEEDWSAVEVVPVKKLKKPVTLASIKAHPLLSTMQLVRRSRISVVRVTEEEVSAVLKLAATKL
jgi:predicted RNA-binding protein with PUA-like domain